MLPAAASLQKQGANKGATTAFLISTPESGVDSIAITYALLDPLMTVFRPLAAFFTALSAGSLENFLNWQKQEREPEPDLSCPVDNCCDGVDCPTEVHRSHHTFLEKIQAGIRYAVTDVWADIVVWFALGLLAAAVITVVIPDALMVSVLGGGLVSMFVMLLIGVPLYICATASTPVAAALILKGVSPGAALVFLLVGPATNVTSLSVLYGILGKGSTLRYLIVLSLCAVLAGLGLDWIYGALSLSPQAIIGEAGEIMPLWAKMASTGVLLLISIQPLYKRFRQMLAKEDPSRHFISDFPVVPRAAVRIPNKASVVSKNRTHKKRI